MYGREVGFTCRLNPFFALQYTTYITLCRRRRCRCFQFLFEVLDLQSQDVKKDFDFFPFQKWGK